MSYTLPDGYAKSKSKILITVGEKERGSMKQSYKMLVNNNENSEGFVFPNIGHGAPLALPDLFNRTIEQWIKKNKTPIS